MRRPQIRFDYRAALRAPGVYALCSLWAYVLGAASYWSTWGWARYVDLAVMSLVGFAALAAVSPGKPNWKLALHAVPLVACVALFYQIGLIAYGFIEDPRM